MHTYLGGFSMSITRELTSHHTRRTDMVSDVQSFKSFVDGINTNITVWKTQYCVTFSLRMNEYISNLRKLCE